MPSLPRPCRLAPVEKARPVPVNTRHRAGVSAAARKSSASVMSLIMGGDNAFKTSGSFMRRTATGPSISRFARSNCMRASTNQVGFRIESGPASPPLAFRRRQGLASEYAAARFPEKPIREGKEAFTIAAAPLVLSVFEGSKAAVRALAVVRLAAPPYFRATSCLVVRRGRRRSKARVGVIRWMAWRQGKAVFAHRWPVVTGAVG